MFKKKYPQPPIIVEPPTPPRPNFVGIDAAIAYVKGYCNKHRDCDERCRLYDTEDGSCMFYDAIAGTPCDWELPKRRVIEEDEE